MQQYAYKWRAARNQGGNGYNSYYLAFKDDCTNFMSQILHAGGVPMQDYNFQQPQTRVPWFQDASRDLYTYSWINASDFFHWAIQNHFAENLHAQGNWQTGDMVAWAWNGSTNVSHVNYVYGLDSQRWPEFLQHTTDYGSPHDWRKFFADLPNDKPRIYKAWWVHIRFINTNPFEPS